MALVSRISLAMPLEPGDVILCGTSLGVLPMKTGSVAEVDMDGIGVLGNRFGQGLATHGGKSVLVRPFRI